GAPIPQSSPAQPAVISITDDGAQETDRMEPMIVEVSEAQILESGEEMDGGQQESVFEQPAAAAGSAAGLTTGSRVTNAEQGPGHRRKRRGRRGGRGRNKGNRNNAPGQVAQPSSHVPPSMFDRAAEVRPYQSARPHVSPHASAHALEDVAPSRAQAELGT